MLWPCRMRWNSWASIPGSNRRSRWMPCANRASGAPRNGIWARPASWFLAAVVGSPYFTTDSGAALRAAEMKCDALLKGTSVDGVYDADPKVDPDAKRYETVDYDTVLAGNLKVMDASAVALCRDNDIPIVVFSIREQGNLARVLAGQGAHKGRTEDGADERE